MLNYTPLRHALVATSRGSSGAFPVQIEGTLTNGRCFYFRYRYGHASVGLGATPDDAVGDSFECGIDYGDEWDGTFDSDEECNEVFAMVLAERLGHASQHGEPS